MRGNACVGGTSCRVVGRGCDNSLVVFCQAVRISPIFGKYIFVYSQLINAMIHRFHLDISGILKSISCMPLQFLVQSTTSEPLSSHQSISLSSSAPPISPSGVRFPSAMRIQSSPEAPRGALNNFNNLRRRMRNGADGNTFTTLVKAATVVDGGGLTAEKLALISGKVVEH
jgi:hypothetical protein